MTKGTLEGMGQDTGHSKGGDAEREILKARHLNRRVELT